MRVRLWGTRGSLAVAGPATIAYGGNTACVEVRPSDDHLVVLDAGTGIRPLGTTVGADVRRIDILLTHLHMDHVQGLGFFAPLFEERAGIHVWGPPSLTQTLRERLTRYLSPPLFPVALRDLPCQPTFHDAPMIAPVKLESLDLSAALVIHPGPTLGYRLSDGRSTLAYLPDHEPALASRHFSEPPEWLSGAGLATGADVLIHDAQYADNEYPSRVGWGHSTLAHAFRLASAARVRRLVTFHHDPSHDDATLSEMLRTAERRGDVELIGGREGLELDTTSPG